MKILKAALCFFFAINFTPEAAGYQGADGATDGAAKVRAHIAAMCTLTGDWSGRFEQFNETGLYNSSPFDAGFRCQPGGEVLMETNNFYQDDGTVSSTLKVIFPAQQPAQMQMSYFYEGIEKVYFFKAANLEYRDDKHWTSIRESTEKTSESDETSPASRYTHIRNDNEMIMIREVKPDHAASKWSLSAKLVLTLQP